MRVVEYEVPNREGKGEIFCLITTIMDPEDATAAELAAAYQERWEFESSLDEIKTHQRGRGGVLRSKSPEMIRQEIWAFLLTHYAIRNLMCEAADQAGRHPVPIVVHTVAARHPPPGHRPGGIFPPGAWLTPSPRLTRRSLKGSTRPAGIAAARESSSAYTSTPTGRNAQATPQRCISRHRRSIFSP